MSKIDISIIIVNFNTGQYLKRCLVSLSKTTADLLGEVIVVDNASSDGSEKTATEFNFAKLIKNKKNLGFAAGCNIGIKNSHGRYILLLNPDTEVEKDTLKVMMDFMDKNPKIGASTCKVILANGQIDWASHRGFPTPLASFSYFSRLSKFFPKSKLLSQYHLTYKDLNKLHDIDSPSGAFYLVRRQVLEKVGYLDEDYFMYGEDIDLSYRIKKAGYKIVYNPSAKIIHYKGIASGIKEHSKELSGAKLSSKIKAANSFYDTMWIFYIKHYRGKYPKPVNFLVKLGINFLKSRRLAKIKSGN